MAKRLINKSRIKRLTTLPWEPGVEEKDLPKANYEELRRAVHMKYPLLGLARCLEPTPEAQLVNDQYNRMCVRFETMREEFGDSPFMTPEEVAARPEPESRPEEELSILVMADDGTFDEVFPKLDNRLDQVDAINLIDPSNLNCQFDWDDHLFVLEFKRPACYLALRGVENQLPNFWLHVTDDLIYKEISQYPWPTSMKTHVFELASNEALAGAKRDLEELASRPNGSELTEPALLRQILILQKHLEERRYGVVNPSLLEQICSLENGGESDTVYDLSALPMEYVYMMEAEWIDEVYPGLTHDQQAAEIEKLDEDILACVWIEGHDFQLYSLQIKDFPFKAILLTDPVEGLQQHNKTFNSSMASLKS